MVAVGAEALALGGAAGAGCAQTGAEIAIAATAVPISRCFMIVLSLTHSWRLYFGGRRRAIDAVRDDHSADDPSGASTVFFLIFSVVPTGLIEVVAAILVSIAARLKECGAEGRSILGAADRFRLGSGDNSRAFDNYRQRE